MNFSSMTKNYEIISNLTPSLRYDGKSDFSEWQAKAKETLAELIGMHKYEKCDPQFNIEYRIETDEYIEYRFTIQSEPGYYFPSVMRVPLGFEEGKHPFILCLQGHSKGMHISLGVPKFPGDENSIGGGDRDFCVRAVKEGYIALAVEQRCFGECNGREEPGPNCYESSMRALLTGRTTIGERVWDCMRALDAVLEHFDFIDEEKICIMGNSGGGTATYYAGCLDERFKLVMPSCSVCSWDMSIAVKRHCACNYVPYIANYFDMGDMGCLIAPRKLVVVHGVLDQDFKAEGVYKSFDLIKAGYTAAGVPENCVLVSGTEGHRFYADLSWAEVRRLMK